MIVRAVLRFWLMVLAYVIGLLLFGPLTLVATPFVLMIIWDAATVVRRSRRDAILGYLDQAVRLNHPLPDVLDVAAISEGGLTGRRLRELSLAIGYGESIGRALEKTVPEIDQHATQLIATAERTGQLGPTLRRLLDHDRLVQGAGRQGVWFEWLYPVWLLGCVLGLLVTLAVFIMPKIELIFEDYGVAMPPVSQSLLDAVSFAYDSGVIPLTRAMLLLAWLIISLVATAGALMPMLPRRHSTFREMLGGVAWQLPGLRSLITARGLNDVCYSASLSVRSGVPLHRALVEATQLDLNPGLRRRVLNWADRIEAGEPIDDAARRAGLPALLVGMLGSAQRDHAVADVFAFLSRYYDGRFSRALMMLRGAFLPGATILLGLLVGWIVLALFTPIVTLIDAAINTSGLT
ncbi:MAG: hypothetical protein GC159_04730 [Phycisphaera sp.]|nr:hypothetical protein [Phycisphaera sp.]